MSSVTRPATDQPTMPATTVALKEWGAAIHALLRGRQTILLRKGGIHEKAFTTPDGGGWWALFPTVAHTHAERTKPRDRDLLEPGAADATDEAVTIRAAVTTVDIVEVARPERLSELTDLHIWTDESIQVDRVEFRPKHPLQVLVVRAHALAEPVTLPRLESYGGCKSWIDVAWAAETPGGPVLALADVEAVAERVRATVG